MQATRLPRLHVITDTRGPVAAGGFRSAAQRDPLAHHDGIADIGSPAASAGLHAAARRDPALAVGLGGALDRSDPDDSSGAGRAAPMEGGFSGAFGVAMTAGDLAGDALNAATRSVPAVGDPDGFPQGRPAAAVRRSELLAAGPRDPVSVVAAALAAGARLVQIRPEDHYTDRAAFDLAAAIAALCDAHGALCLVNDRVHIAQAVGADGVHLGADDLPVDVARRLLPAASIIGGTCRDPESARAARRAGATYLGVGPVWATSTKAGLPQAIGLEGLAAVCEAVDLPVIAIGGITAERAAQCREVGAYGVAVVGAIAAADDPGRATAELLEAVGESPTGSGLDERTADRNQVRLRAAGEARPGRDIADAPASFIAPQGDQDRVRIEAAGEARPSRDVADAPASGVIADAAADRNPVRPDAMDGSRPGHDFAAAAPEDDGGSPRPASFSPAGER
nr:thiamine phosphate synthase [Glycomyces harbinensis]